MTKAIITVVGKDAVGIIAKVCTYLADNQVNILDITQTIEQVSNELTEIGKSIGVQTKIQLEEIFNQMHRI